MALAEKLARAVPRVAVSDAPVDQIAYARDLWPRWLLELRAGRVAEHRPAAIVWPETTEQVARIVRWAREENVPVVPFGAGSGVCGGVSPDARTIVVDLKRMSRWRALDPAAPSLDVEAGALGIQLEEELVRRGFTLGHFPSSIVCSTVGGWVAARSAGQCSGKYGKIEDMVASLECVLGDGEVVTLHRRPGGLDLTPLVVGSEGTMAVVTSAKLRLHAAPASRAYVSFSFPDVEAGWTAMRAIFQAGLRPPVSRLYDPFDSYLAKRGSVKAASHGAGKKKSGPPGQALATVLRAPGMLNALVDSVGEKFFGGATLILIFEGSAEEAHDDAARASAICEKLGATSLGEGPARRWLQHRYSVSYRMAPVFMRGAFVDTIEVASPWSRLGELYDGVRRALGQHVFVMAHLSHAYPDGCSIYFSFAGAGKDDESSLRAYDETWRSALDAAIAAGGTISHHHGVGRSKAPRLGAELGKGLDVVRALMRAADPGGILNPGNLVPADAQAGPTPPSAGGGPIAVDRASLLVRVAGHVPLGVLAPALAAEGLGLDLRAPFDARETVASWLARGAPGAFDPWEDPADHLVAGLRARLASGAELVVRPTPRRAAGPDLVALFVGAGDRFGTIEEATIRVRPDDAPAARPLPFASDRRAPVEPGEERLAARFAEAVRAVR